jgi:hypothetical protein
MQNETVRTEVTEGYAHVRAAFVRRVQHRLIDEVKEHGFPYPPQDYLDTLTEEQAALILTTIDQINATYDWPNMTDEEIQEALQVARDELALVYEELELDPPAWRDELRERIGQRIRQRARHRMFDYLQENGIPYPQEDVLASLTEEQASAVTALIDSYNETYDWAELSPEEVRDALVLFRQDMNELKEDLGIDAPLVRPPHPHGHDRPFDDDSTLPDEDDVSDDTDSL